MHLPSSPALHPWPVTQHPLQHETPSLGFQLRLSTLSPVLLLQHDVTTASAYRHQQTAMISCKFPMQVLVAILHSAIPLVVLQALVVPTCMSAEGHPRMQLLTGCALWFR